MENDIVLKTENLRKVYRVGKIEIHALKGVDLAIKRGEFVSIVGPSGCGKSTLLYLMGGMAKPTAGKVIVDGIELSSVDENVRARIRRKKIGFVFQMFNLFPTLTALGNLEIAMQIANEGRSDKEKALRLLELVGLKNKVKHKPLELSMGEQQRVAIARALINEPDIILADEPTGNLDSANSDIIIDLLRELNERLNQTIVMITHNLEAAYRADRQIYMKDGRIIHPSELE
ncbi:MAG: ABC transporter ATP-binding protein [Acidobacteria bacterium]|nr:ABC transporter ATP-binding protein [Acidobacteriota bacterium]